MQCTGQDETVSSEQIEIRFDREGLVPAVLQDASSGEVLMVAWMNREALRLTRETGQAHFWSRSREVLWHKGATSGNFMNVRDILVDCDGDTLLVKVDPEGPACHTGRRSCFVRHGHPHSHSAPDREAGNSMSDIPSAGRAEGESGILDELFDVIRDRQANRPPGSYTAKLLDAGEDEILKKVGEEAVEVLLAAKGQRNERLVSEMADLTYHVLVLLAARGLELADVEAELAKRRR
jgi:phosphoribosyl-ATP pyrophosphohydrolase/phosphoribosyl-AMP cyclohydrolase